MKVSTVRSCRTELMTESWRVWQVFVKKIIIIRLVLPGPTCMFWETFNTPQKEFSTGSGMTLTFSYSVSLSRNVEWSHMPYMQNTRATKNDWNDIVVFFCYLNLWVAASDIKGVRFIILSRVCLVFISETCTLRTTDKAVFLARLAGFYGKHFKVNEKLFLAFTCHDKHVIQSSRILLFHN